MINETVWVVTQEITDTTACYGDPESVLVKVFLSEERADEYCYNAYHDYLASSYFDTHQSKGISLNWVYEEVGVVNPNATVEEN